MTLSRQQIIGGIVGVIVAALAVYGIWLIADSTNPYKGLVTERPTEMDDATREYFEQRLATTKAAIEAAEGTDEGVDLDLYLGAASDAYVLGDLVTTREMLEKQLAGNSINFVAWNNYALVLEDMGDYKNAETAFRKTLEIEQGIAKYYVDYADFLKTHYPERREDLKTLIEANLELGGQTVWNMVALGDWYAAGGECNKGVDHYEVAVALDPENQALKDDMLALEKSCQ